MKKQAPENAFVFPLPAVSLEKFDLGGVLYHANYFHLLEQGREALLASFQTPYPALVSKSQHLAVTHSELTFLQAVRYGELLRIAIWSSEVKRSTVRLNYILYKEQDDAVHLASTKLVFVQLKTGVLKPTKFSEKLKETFLAIENE